MAENEQVDFVAELRAAFENLKAAEGMKSAYYLKTAKAEFHAACRKHMPDIIRIFELMRGVAVVQIEAAPKES